MSNPKQILELERFDSYLEPTELLNNVKNLVDYLSKQNPPFPVDQIRPTMSYLIETSELMNSNDDSLRLQLAISFVQAYRISSPEQPINQDSEKYLYRLFTLLNNVFNKYGKNDDNQNDIVSLIQLTDQIGLYGLAVNCGLDKEIFSTFIKIDMPESIDNLAKLINESNRIPSKILAGMCDLITTNKNVELLLLKISDLKQKEFTQGIRSNIQDLSGVECIQVFEKVASTLNMPPSELYDYVQIDIENEDDQIREATVDLLTKQFSEIPFNPQNQPYITTLISRHFDPNYKVRLIAIKFGFEELLKIKDYKKDKDQNNNQNEDVTKSAIKKITNDVWEMADERIVDNSTEVRCAILKGIYHLDAKDVKLNEKKISFRLSDKKPDVRAVALKVMLKLYDAKPDKFEWLIQPVIELYSISKDIALYGFSILMSNHSLIEVASKIQDRRPLLDILKDTNELRLNLPEIKNSEESQQIVLKKLPENVDIKKLLSLLKKAPKSFFTQALDYKKRKNLNKVLKEKIGSDAHLLLGLYQPSPLNIDDLLNCKQLDLVHDLGCIYTDQLEDEIPRLLKRCNKTDLTILAAFKHYELEMDVREKILKALIPVIKTTPKKRKLALKAFANLYRKDKSTNDLLDEIKFDKKDILEKISFYGHFVDKNVYTKSLYDEINKNIDLFDEDTIKYALKIAITEKKERTMNILMHTRVTHPDISFKYYLLSAKDCYRFITPDVFRQFAYVMQNEEKEVRTNAIRYLTEALQLPTTPIQFLALFALSATDPTQQNVNEAEKQLREAVKLRRKLMKKSKEYKPQITPEFALPYLVNVLAHHKDFEKDLPNLATFSMYLRFFLTPLCATTKQFQYIINLCERYLLLDDVEEEYTKNNTDLFNLAITIVTELGQGKEWDPNPIETEYEYSKRYFKQPEDDKERFREVYKHSRDNLKSPMRPKNILRAGMTNSNISKSKYRTLADSDESEDESSSKSMKSVPATPKRKKSTQSKESKRKTVAISALSTPKRSTKKTKKEPSTSGNEEDAADDQESSSTTSKKLTTQKKRAASAAQSPARSPKRGRAKQTEEKSEETKSVKKSAKSSAKTSASTTPKRNASKTKTTTKKTPAKSKKQETPRRSPKR